MDQNVKYYSEMERYEIINVNDGNRYNYLGNNDIIVNSAGNLEILVLSDNKTKFSIFGKNEFIEVPWEYVKKIGAKTIIIDVEEKNLKKLH
ncbi:YlmC/YmxH family sporulation protein [Clostridium luticellarii]|uniref:PRC-barrel domain protein n=1 Tax=Clostridium luticellarii TaxID=1691940 RepID=A0A2T0BHG1_9CLOT|nr:YlmC/YmxH family sporulation protein [Clostridium luticellarii]MCI1943928.1 YlmC/YmxH family sporulation protein [Clostridium luticellarii]MCI1967189.1 YlmC/YmxH family sporulation protein [Clostridium luticellarii]MCI1995920.1 YlmC/YmxH family sporulation protein [Clostridium luticellarii]MCI2038491.1 YlmC/YmxH family sporulation protein [Clostridium luticellarii]PRR83339.1 PRC-barrel domain protein [Clostridium luticellarii]